MGTESDGMTDAEIDELLATLAHRRRRRALRRLRERGEPVETAALAGTLATDEDGTAVLTELVHRHLPKLADVGLVRWDREAGVVATADHPVYAAPDLDRVLSAGEEDWSDVLRALADVRRRVVVATLATRDDALDRQTLARHVAAREAGVVPSAPSEEAIDSVAVMLHHVHLPVLADAGLVALEDEAVRYEGHPALDETWISFDVEPSASEPDRTDPVADASVEQVVRLVE